MEGKIPAEVLNDLCSRFIMNIPDEEKLDPVRACFQIELAHWFYLDYMCGEDESKQCSLRDFISAIFSHCPHLRPYSIRLREVIDKWREYKSTVPLYGAILINSNRDKVLLVQGYYAKSSWGFPKGKVNENEAADECAIRETLEEVGYDIRPLMDTAVYAERRLGDSNKLGLFLVTGVDENYMFRPMTKQEIRTIRWFSIDHLPLTKDDLSKEHLGYHPKAFFMVIPFIDFIHSCTERPLPAFALTPRLRRRRTRGKRVSSTATAAKSITGKFHAETGQWSADGTVTESESEMQGTLVSSTTEAVVVRMKPGGRLFNSHHQPMTMNSSTPSRQFAALQTSDRSAFTAYAASQSVDSGLSTPTNGHQLSPIDESGSLAFYPIQPAKAWTNFRFDAACVKQIQEICARSAVEMERLWAPENHSYRTRCTK